MRLSIIDLGRGHQPMMENRYRSPLAVRPRDLDFDQAAEASRHEEPLGWIA